MKTTVKLTKNTAMEVAPASHANALFFSVSRTEGEGHYFMLTPDQAGALIFGMEQALEVIDQRHRAQIETMRAAA